jgi:hypothetical protein
MRIALAAGLALLPCLWDRDTIDDELRGLPEARVLVTGRWFRHGPAYYQTRIARLPGHLEANPIDLAAYDDLGVAHERLGDREAAMRVMARKAEALARKPNEEHQYRYHANLGTFLAHAGRLDEALLHLEQAVRINPDAHFGRERYQIDAIRYVRLARRDPEVWKEHNILTFAGYRLGNGITATSNGDRKLDWKSAYTGIAGMLRFGGLEGAELYRCLGDLFWTREDLNLAWWCYMRAVDKEHPARMQIELAIHRIEEHWRQGGAQSPPRAEDFEAVKANGEAWLARFHAEEATAIERGEDPGEPETLWRLLAACNQAVPAEMPPWRVGSAEAAYSGTAPAPAPFPSTPARPNSPMFLIGGIAAMGLAVSVTTLMLSSRLGRRRIARPRRTRRAG